MYTNDDDDDKYDFEPTRGIISMLRFVEQTKI